jgi:hypothetical protein
MLDPVHAICPRGDRVVASRMWLYLLVLALAVLAIFGGALGGGVFTIVLVPLAAPRQPRSQLSRAPRRRPAPAAVA